MGSIPDFTTVTGVDRKHLRQLAMTWPTWRRHKSQTILRNPLVVFHERTQVRAEEVRSVCDHPHLTTVAWPPEGQSFYGDNSSKWESVDRHKMLAGFVYVPASSVVATPYFLKLDTDAVATGVEDWIDAAWFADDPAIVAPPWGFTRPADQMLRLDAWANDLELFKGTQPLGLAPRPGEDRVCHPRIGSWCAFFNNEFNRLCAMAALESVGSYQLPVASQDGFLFYAATRLGRRVVRPRMKARGWDVWSTEGNIARAVQRSMENHNGQ